MAKTVTPTSNATRAAARAHAAAVAAAVAAGVAFKAATPPRISAKTAHSPATAVLAMLANIPDSALRALATHPDLASSLVRSHLALPDAIFDDLLTATKDPTHARQWHPATLFCRPLSAHQRLALVSNARINKHALYDALLYNDLTAEELRSLPLSPVTKLAARALSTRYRHRPDCLAEVLPRLPMPFALNATLRAPSEVLSDEEVLSALRSYHPTTLDVAEDEELRAAFTDLIEIRPHLVARLLQVRASACPPLYEPGALRLALASSRFAAAPEVLRDVREEKGKLAEEIAQALMDNPAVPTGFLTRHNPLRAQHLPNVPSYFVSLPHRAIAADLERLTDRGSDVWKDTPPRHWDLLALSQNPNLDVAQAKKIATCLTSEAAAIRLGTDRINTALLSLDQRFPTTTLPPFLSLPPLNPPMKHPPVVTYFQPGVTLETIQNLAALEKTPNIVGDAGFLDDALHHSPDNWVRFLRQIDHVPPATTLLAVAATITRAQQQCSPTSVHKGN